MTILLLLRSSHVFCYFNELNRVSSNVMNDADHVANDQSNLNQKLDDLECQVRTQKHNSANDDVHDDI